MGRKSKALKEFEESQELKDFSQKVAKTLFDKMYPKDPIKPPSFTSVQKTLDSFTTSDGCEMKVDYSSNFNNDGKEYIWLRQNPNDIVMILLKADIPRLIEAFKKIENLDNKV